MKHALRYTVFASLLVSSLLVQGGAPEATSVAPTSCQSLPTDGHAADVRLSVLEGETWRDRHPADGLRPGEEAHVYAKLYTDEDTKLTVYELLPTLEPGSRPPVKGEGYFSLSRGSLQFRNVVLSGDQCPYKLVFAVGPAKVSKSIAWRGAAEDACVLPNPDLHRTAKAVDGKELPPGHALGPLVVPCSPASAEETPPTE